MDHGYIEEHQIVSLYAMGKLSPADRFGFEDHLVECRQCQDELELTEDFRRGLQDVVSQDEIRSGASRTAAGWLSGFRAWRPVAAFAFALLAVAGFLFITLNRGLRLELERTRAAASDWERRYSGEQQARLLAESQLRDAPAQGAAPLFTLNLTRGAGLAAAEPPNTVSISPSAKSLVLSLEWQNDPDFQSYRAMLVDATGHSVWSAGDIPAPSSGALAITLSANLLHPGKYLLTVEGMRAGSYSAIGHYSFRVTPSK